MTHTVLYQEDLEGLEAIAQALYRSGIVTHVQAYVVDECSITMFAMMPVLADKPAVSLVTSLLAATADPVTSLEITLGVAGLPPDFVGFVRSLNDDSASCMLLIHQVTVTYAYDESDPQITRVTDRFSRGTWLHYERT